MKDITPEDREKMRQAMVENANAEAAELKAELQQTRRNKAAVEEALRTLRRENEFFRRIIEKLVD